MMPAVGHSTHTLLVGLAIVVLGGVAVALAETCKTGLEAEDGETI
jgi:hypothetical protein